MSQTVQLDTGFKRPGEICITMNGAENCPLLFINELEKAALPIKNMEAFGADGIPTKDYKLVYSYQFVCRKSVRKAHEK